MKNAHGSTKFNQRRYSWSGSSTEVNQRNVEAGRLLDHNRHEQAETGRELAELRAFKAQIEKELECPHCKAVQPNARTPERPQRALSRKSDQQARRHKKCTNNDGRVEEHAIFRAAFS